MSDNDVMNPDTMTVDECRDWLARDDGWEFKHNSWWHPTIMALYHPYPATLDSATSAMPKEFWYKVFVNPNGRVDAIAQRGFMTIDVAATTELEARYRLAVKCRLALKTRSE